MTSTGMGGLANGTPGDRGKIYEISQKWSERLLGSGRWARVGVIGEGSCFFHSICYVTNRDGYICKSEKDQMDIAANFRCHSFKSKFTKHAYDEFKKTTPGYSKTYDELMDSFCDPSVWADEVMIKYACKLLGQNIIFLDLKSEKVQCNVHSKKSLQAVARNEIINEPTIIVAWVSRSHFEPIVLIKNSKEGRIRSVFNPAVSTEDAEIVEYIMTTMASDCKLMKK